MHLHFKPGVSKSISGGPQPCRVYLQPLLNTPDPANQVPQARLKTTWYVCWSKTLQGCGPPGIEFDTPALNHH